MDLDATGDTTRTDRAFHDFLAAIEHLPGDGRPTAHRSPEPAGTDRPPPSPQDRLKRGQDPQTPPPGETGRAPD
jgi:hypothetical protein